MNHLQDKFHVEATPIIQAHNIVDNFRKIHYKEFRAFPSKPFLHEVSVLYVNNLIATSSGKQFDHYRKVLYNINLMFKEVEGPVVWYSKAEYDFLKANS